MFLQLCVWVWVCVKERKKDPEGTFMDVVDDNDNGGTTFVEGLWYLPSAIAVINFIRR